MTTADPLTPELIQSLTAADGLAFCQFLRQLYFEELQSGHVAAGETVARRELIARAQAPGAAAAVGSGLPAHGYRFRDLERREGIRQLGRWRAHAARRRARGDLRRRARSGRRLQLRPPDARLQSARRTRVGHRLPAHLPPAVSAVRPPAGAAAAQGRAGPRRAAAVWPRALRRRILSPGGELRRRHRCHPRGVRPRTEARRHARPHHRAA